MIEGAKLVHTSRMAVRWGDMDAYGHVNNTIYFRFFEQARCEWIEAIGYPVTPNEPTGAVIINASATFMRPVVYPADVIIKVYAGELGRSSFMTWYELFVSGDEQAYAEGAAKIVWMNNENGRSVALPEDVRGLLEASA